MKQSNTEKEIQLVNKIIEEAIWHGADSGGDYHQNGENLKKAIENWLSFKEYDSEYYVDGDLNYWLTIKKQRLR